MVVTISSNVTATEVAAVQEAEVLVLVDFVVDVVVVPVPLPKLVVLEVFEVAVPLPVTGVWLEGQEVAVAVEYVPVAEVEEQTDGTLDAVDSPHE